MDEMTDEELAAEIERLQQQLAVRKTRRAVERDLAEHVDRVQAECADALEGPFKVGRLEVAEGAVTIERADPTNTE